MFVSLLFAAFSTKGLTLLRLLLMPTAPRKGQQTCRASADNLSGITHTGKVFVAASGSAQLNTSARYVAYHSIHQITLSTLFSKLFQTAISQTISQKSNSKFTHILHQFRFPRAHARAIYNLFYLLYYFIFIIILYFYHCKKLKFFAYSFTTFTHITTLRFASGKILHFVTDFHESRACALVPLAYARTKVKFHS